MLKQVGGDIRSFVVGSVLTTIGVPALIALVIGYLTHLHPMVILFAVLGAGALGAVIRIGATFPALQNALRVTVTDAEWRIVENRADKQPTNDVVHLEVHLTLGTRSEPGSVSEAKVVCGDRNAMCAFLIEEDDENGPRRRLFTGSSYPNGWHEPNLLRLPAHLGPYETEGGWVVFAGEWTLFTKEQADKHPVYLEVLVNGRRERHRLSPRVVR